MSVLIHDLDTLLEQSAATAEFKDAVHTVEHGKKTPLISFNGWLPRVKILRVIAKLLEQEPGLNIQNVSIEGESGCSDFEGTASVNSGERKFVFWWDCRWRAQEEGMVDAFGYPDQIRAAQQFGYQCFERFERIK